MNEKVEKAGAAIPDWLCLSDHTSRWNMDLYLAVDKEIDGAQNVRLSGKFLSNVYEGPYKDTGKWCKDFEKLAQTKGLTIKKWYMWYTTCPKCAKKVWQKLCCNHLAGRIIKTPDRKQQPERQPSFGFCFFKAGRESTRQSQE
jgi:hypothetical protein